MDVDSEILCIRDDLGEIRGDIGEIRGDIKGMTGLVAEYVSRLDGAVGDHEERLRCVEDTLLQMQGRDRVLGYIKDAVIAFIAAFGGLLLGKGG